MFSSSARLCSGEARQIALGWVELGSAYLASSCFTLCEHCLKHTRYTVPCFCNATAAALYVPQRTLADLSSSRYVDIFWL